MSFKRVAAATLILHCHGITNSSAQIVTDGSLGPGGALVGPDFVIGEVLGTRLGSNLFHSFSDFNVQTGQSATFTSNFIGPTSNVISRVTGGNGSVIDGLLRSEIAGAEFWLINPNGLVFGENAVLDVPAGFHASTADLLELADGGEFRATNPDASSLTVAPPSAFGFLDASIGSISVDGATLAVAAGENLSFVGGAQSFTDATLTAAGGRIDLVGAASAGEVAAVGTHGNVLVPTNMTAFADIEMNTTTLQAGTNSAQNGGTIGIVGDEITLGGGGTIDVSASSTGDAGRVVMEAATEVTVWQLSDILADSAGVGAGAGAAGSIEITANRILVALGSTLSASTVDGSNTGAGGEPVGSRIDLQTNDLLVDVGTQILARTTGAGQGGSISVTALDPAEEFSIRILEESSIQTGASGTGDAGSIQLGSAAAPADLIRLAPGLFQENSGIGLFSNTVGIGPDAGDAGSIEIHARELTILGANISVASGTFGQADAGGDAGSIDLHVGSLSFTGRGASISGETNGTGDSGSITVTGDYSETPTIVMIDGVMTTRSRGSGNAGNIVIGSESNPFESIVVRDNFQGSLPNDFPQGFESTSLGTGDAGSIEINARNLTLRDGAEISTSTDAGRGGEILLRVDELEVARFSKLTASSSGAGDAGDISITGLGGAPASLVVLTGTGNAPGPDTGIFSNGGGTGAAGDLSIHATSVVVENGASISADTRDGAGGTVTIRANTVDLFDSQISVIGLGQGDAGDISIAGAGSAAAATNLTIRGSETSGLFSSSNATGASAGAAGSIAVEALDIEVSGGLIGATTVDGAGGSVDIRVDQLHVSEGGIFAGTRGEGDGGQVLVRGMSATAAALVEMTTGGRISSNSVYVDPGTGPGSTAGSAGDVSITTVELRLSSDEIVTRVPAIDATTGDGAGGAIALFVDTLTMDGGVILASTGGTGDAGTISITGIDGAPANLIELRSPTSFITTSTNTLTNRTGGDAGSIDVTARNIDILAGGILSNTPGQGAGGSIHIAVDHLNLQGEQSQINVGSSGPGNAGNIVIEGIGSAPATGITLSDGSAIRSESVLDPNFLWDNLGAAGSISIDARSVSLDGFAELSVDTASEGGGGVIDLGVDTLAITGGAAINARTSGFGLAGDINIHGVDDGRATTVEIAGEGSRISSASVGTGENAGAAGNIGISTDSVSVADQASISAETVDGQGGAIAMDVGQLTVASGGLVTTSVTGAGTGGSILIAAGETVLLDAGDLLAESSGGGASGSVTVNAQELRLQNAAGLSVRSTGAGRAGSVFTDLGSLFMTGNSQIDATAAGSLAGNVELNVSGIAFLQDSIISGLSADPDNDGGNFIIRQPQALVLQRSSILANSGSGTGGNISITADAIVIDVDSTVEATGQVLAVGEVLGSVLQLDPPVVVDAAAALDTSCTTQQAEERSSMIVRSTPPGAVREPYLPADATVASPSCRP